MNNLTALSGRVKKYSGILLYDSKLYQILARSAPDERSQKITQSFSDQCRNSAENLYEIYRNMTHDHSDIQFPSVRETGSFRSVLRSRLSHELQLESEFRNEYLNISDNFRLKRIFYNASHSAMSRALGILDMLI